MPIYDVSTVLTERYIKHSKQTYVYIDNNIFFWAD